MITKKFQLIFLIVSYLIFNNNSFGKKENLSPIIGSHLLNFNYVNYKENGFGYVSIEEISDTENLYIYGDQVAADESEYVEIEGQIIDYRLNDRSGSEFIFEGTIHTKSIGKDKKTTYCKREGTFLFQSRNGRAYWRLQNIHNPCLNGQIDYIDIFIQLEN